MAAAGGDRAQCADGVEADRVARGIIAGATEAAAFSDHQHGGAVGATCAENAAAAGRIGRAHRPMEGGLATAASRYMREGCGTRIGGFSWADFDRPRHNCVASRVAESLAIRAAEVAASYHRSARPNRRWKASPAAKRPLCSPVRCLIDGLGDKSFTCQEHT